MRRNRSARRTRGFTLVEILVVITIIGLLASILIPVVTRIREQAKRAAGATLLKGIDAAFSAYYADVGRYPGDAYVNWNAAGSVPADVAATETWVYWLLNGRTVYLGGLKDKDLAGARTSPSVYLKDAWNYRVLYVVAPLRRDHPGYLCFPGNRAGGYNLWSVGSDGKCDSCGEYPATNPAGAATEFTGTTHDAGGDPEGTWHVGGDTTPNDDIRQ